MRPINHHRVLALSQLVLFALLLPACTSMPKTPDGLVQAYEATDVPKIDPERRRDVPYVKRTRKQMLEAQRKMFDYAYALYDNFPDDPRAPEMFIEGSELALYRLRDRDPVKERLPGFIEKHPGTPEETEALFLSVIAYAHSSNWDLDQTMPHLDRFIEHAPTDKRGPQMLTFTAERNIDTDPQRAAAMLRRAIDHPSGQYDRRARGKLLQIEGRGRPFELTFTDFTTGDTIDVQSMKGSVIVIDFWATWCGPCVKELPNLKNLYDTYHVEGGGGLEIIGISLDYEPAKDGDDKLAAFLEDNDYPWPQYYQGKGWNGDFSRKWGIYAVPALFIIDTEGRLHSTTARHKLETMVPELLGITPTE